MARRTHDVVATVGRYKGEDGEERKRFSNVGSAFTDDQGRVSIKLDLVPVTPEWSGWLSLYPVKEAGLDRVPPRRRSGPAGGSEGPGEVGPRRSAAPRFSVVSSNPGGTGMEEEDVPF